MLLVADFTVDLENTFDVLTDVGDDRAGESVLGVGVDVHLHDAVSEGLLKVFAGGAGAAVEHEVHFSGRAVLVHDGFLAIAEDAWLQLHRAWLVGTVDVAEGSGKEEAAEWLERFVNFHHVLRRGVELFARETGCVVAVFLTTDTAGFDFEDDAELGALLEEGFRDLEVFLQVDHGAVEHVGLEKWSFASGDALAGGLEEGLEEAVNLGRVAVVGVEGDENVVFLSEQVASLGENDRAESGVFHRGARGEFTATGGNLDDAVGFRFGEGLESTVDGGQGGDVDGRIGVAALLGGIEHGAVLFGSGDRHDGMCVTKGRDSDKRGICGNGKADACGLPSHVPPAWLRAMPTASPDKIVCKPTPWFILRAVAMLLMFSVFAAYFAFDGAVGYRKKNKEYFIHATFKKAKDEFEAKSKEGTLTAEAWKEHAASRSVWFPEDAYLLPKDLQQPMPWPAILQDYEKMKPLQFHLLWQEYSGEHGYNDKPKEKPFSRREIREQWFFSGLCAVLSVVTLFFLLRTIRRSISADQEGITSQTGKRVPYGELKSLDLRKWSNKGLAFATYDGASGKGKVRIDGLTYGGFKKEDGEPAEKLMQFIRSRFSGEIIEYTAAAETDGENPPEKSDVVSP